LSRFRYAVRLKNKTTTPRDRLLTSFENSIVQARNTVVVLVVGQCRELDGSVERLMFTGGVRIVKSSSADVSWLQYYHLSRYTTLIHLDKTGNKNKSSAISYSVTDQRAILTNKKSVKSIVICQTL